MPGLSTVANISPVNQQTATASASNLCKSSALRKSPYIIKSIWCHPRGGLDSDCGPLPHPINITGNLDTQCCYTVNTRLVC